MSDNILVTGRWGETHVTSAQAGNFNSGIVGDGCYVMSGLDATMTSANTCHISPGFGSFNGRDFEVPAGGIDLTIDNGTQAQYRNDLVVVRYALEPSSQTESAELVVVKGAPAASEPADPAINEGSILDGDSPVDMPLWRIPLDGITVGDPVRIFQTVAPLADAQPETGEDGGWTWRKWPDGTAECWGAFTAKQSNYEVLSGDWTYSTKFLNEGAAPLVRAFPSGLFSESPTVDASLAANRYGFAQPSAVTASQMGVGCVFHGVVSSQITFYLSARGRWK